MNYPLPSSEPTVRVRSGTGPGFAWETAEADLHPRLAPFAFRLLGYSEWSADPMRRLEPPYSGIPLILGFGAPITVGGTTYRLERVGAFVAGPDVDAATTEGSGFQTGIQLDMTPLGAARLLGVPLAALARTVVPFTDMLGREGHALIQRLGNTNDWETRLALVQDFALRRIAANPAPPVLVAEIWSRLVASDGRADIAGMAADIGISRKHLTRQFHHWLGLAPSTWGRVLRFDRAVHRIRDARGAVDWAEIALACGYFDQPHFNRDFRAFTGMTPTAFAAALQPHGSVVLPSVG